MRENQPRRTQASHLVPLTDAAETLCVSVKTLRRRISDGSITGYRVGRLVRVDPEEIADRLVVEIPTARRIA